MTPSRETRQRFAELRHRYEWLEYQLSRQDLEQSRRVHHLRERGALRWAMTLIAEMFEGLVAPRKEDEHDHEERERARAAKAAGGAE